MEKSVEDILKQKYMSAKDLSIITGMCNKKSLDYIKDVQEEMKEKNYFVPDTRKYIALTKLIVKRLGI